MSTVAYSSQQTQLKVTISSTPTLIPQIQGFTGPNVQTDLAETTNLDSPTDYKEYQPILKDGGDVSFDMIYNRSNTVHQYLRTANINGSLETFTIDWPSTMPGTSVFNGYVTGFNYQVKKGEVIMVGVTIKVTGAITEAYV